MSTPSPPPVTQIVRAPESSRMLEWEQSDKKDPRRVFKEFGEIFTQASPEAKRRILNIIIEEIRCSVLRGKRKGEILYRLRGDGSVTKEWEQARRHEDPKPPSSGGSSLQVAWLREQDSNHWGRNNNGDI